MSHFGLNPDAAVRWQSASYGKITKAGPAHARGMQIAVVTTARKLTTLCWHLVIKGDDYVVVRVAQPGVPGVRPAGRHDRSTATFSVGTNLPNDVIGQLTVDPNGTLVAATHGRGIWTIAAP